MLGIPPAKDTDAEDVVWGLQTAETLWKRGERIDAVVWGRRSAQAAGDAADDNRALELARSAAELSDWMATLPSVAPAPMPTHAPTYAPPPDFPTYVPGASISSIEVDVDEVPPARASRPMPPQSRPPSQPTMQTAEPSFAEHVPRTTSVPPADKVHAGMFNPWDERAPTSAPAPIAPPPPRTPIFSDEEEVITSVRPQQLQQQRADALAAVLAGGRPESDAPQPPAPVAWADSRPAIEAAAPEPVAMATPSAPPRPGPPRPPPLPPRAMKPKAPSAPAPVRVPSESPMRITPPPPSPTQVMVQPQAQQAEEPPPPAPEPEVPAAAEPAAAVLDLEDVEAFADLPDDARRDFASAAVVSALGEGEEVSSFALAYILSGSVDVAATMVDAPADRLERGAVLRSRGTTTDGVPMRLIGVSNAVVATWTDAAVTEAFRTCPWVEEDLRVAADRLQTLVGVTIGPLGERLDASIREEIIGKLTMRTLIAGDVVVTAGEQMPGLLLIGVGELELVDSGGNVAGVVGSGEFLFPTEVLGGGNAPNTARAGSGGALILFCDRKIAQELLVTCPPLLEVFAGM